ncbi:MAG: hypothetical protein A2589_02095 [Candidatus Vogelbacteria bacterium RIFOXYD1_FULL_46_19]|uniref:D-lactate dehydrogenase (cytochrome) n=1 Tax=Candidatus Vogelbacteria bacterium RIFOXYD1_FULL_46_19 TaxID=1802439 RepID=A0A1G2QHR5_9BACT|nr:MAG: hypothetical protein A2589_02095 [Candidatus Vogelbacteria bacterium RIFOXYD1_FULL_46_19]
MQADFKKILEEELDGEISDQPQALGHFSRDASLFTVKPELVVFPKNEGDLETLVKLVTAHKAADPTLSLSVRAAGTCMSGGSLNKSIIVDVTRHLTGVIAVEPGRASAWTGTFYRDFERATLKTGQLLPSYTASKDLCALGGMIGNNSGGEKTLRYGKTERYIESLSVVLADGKTYELRAWSAAELEKRLADPGFLGQATARLYRLLTLNDELIKKAKPSVSKNSAGYYLWNIWDGQTFDLTRLFVGAQGTLGLVSKATFKLVPQAKYSRLLVIFMPNLKELGQIVSVALRLEPDSIESYDDHTLSVALRFWPAIMKKLTEGSWWKLLWSFRAELKMVLAGGWPKLVLLVELSDTEETKLDLRIKKLKSELKSFKVQTRLTQSTEETSKYWAIRRESFSLLREHSRGRRTAPFIDDIIVRPEYLPEFLPELQTVLDRYNLIYTIAGHAGDGNFHIIPLMNLKDKGQTDLILELSDLVYDLVLKYGGSITAEHNDGIIRTPYLEKMYGSEMVQLFQEVKNIFDPAGIFNPGKKVGGSRSDIRKYLSKS